MRKIYETTLKNLSNAQLATIVCKENVQSSNANLSKLQVDTLLQEAKELEKLAKSLQAELMSIMSI